MKFITPPWQPRPMPEIKFSKHKRKIVRLEIKILLTKEVLNEVEHCPGEFVSNIFLREKKTQNKFRMILNLRTFFIDNILNSVVPLKFY